jgi:gamma-glutamylcyclotransferase
MSAAYTLVFAYGSNMCTRRMCERVASARVLATGFVIQRRIAFHKRSQDGSAKADAQFTGTPNDCVWGVIYRLPTDHKPQLDAYEFLGVGYDEESVDVMLPFGKVQAWMYVARREAIDDELLPYTWYHDLVVHGAQEHHLPDRYVNQLRAFSTWHDSDVDRAARHRLLLDI